MPALAVSALDVALVSALAAVVAAVASPISAWLTARGRNRHERQVAHDQRVFERRCDVYEEAITDVQRIFTVVRANYDLLLEVAFPVDPPEMTTSDITSTAGRYLVFGSPGFLREFSRYRDVATRFLEEALAHHEKRANGQALTDQERVRLSGMFDEVAASRDKVAEAARKDLTELAS